MDHPIDKVKDLKECQEKHEFLKMMTLDDREDGRDALDLIDDYIDQLDRELDDLMDAEYSILETEVESPQWVSCSACTFVMTSSDDLKRHVVDFHTNDGCRLVLTSFQREI